MYSSVKKSDIAGTNTPEYLLQGVLDPPPFQIETVPVALEFPHLIVSASNSPKSLPRWGRGKKVTLRPYVRGIVA